jgi:UDP-GlcNAc:undecaprenyl-phosphate GlcNAc-1-phosphate transferase
MSVDFANLWLYVKTIGTAFLLTLIATPLVRIVAMRMHWLDTPESDVKTHTVATPALGGVGIWIGFAGALVTARFMTSFPSGTLYNLRAVLAGGALVFLLGIFDDLRKPMGLDWKTKMLVQTAAAGMLVFFGIKLRFITPDYLAILLTLVWVVGICNAFNIIDIMDGLAASQGAAAALGFLFIALPSEDVYVNFAAAALIGAAGGFLPWNFSARRKIFMGDSGSLLIGFVLSALALGVDYTQINPLGVFAPLFILAIPMFDTFYVMFIRIRKGLSPFRGSLDHFALRLERIGYTRHQIVALCLVASVFLSLCALLVTLVSTPWAIWIYFVVGSFTLVLARAITRVDME